MAYLPKNYNQFVGKGLLYSISEFVRGIKKKFKAIMLVVNDVCENLPLRVTSGCGHLTCSVLPFAVNGDLKVSNILLPLHVTHCIL